MTAARVLLVTIAGPSGHVDVGVRSDATPAELAIALSPVIGVGPALPVIEHRSPPRPGVPLGRRVLLDPHSELAEAGVADGDLVLFRVADDDASVRSGQATAAAPDDAPPGGRHALGGYAPDFGPARGTTPTAPVEGHDYR